MEPGESFLYSLVLENAEYEVARVRDYYPTSWLLGELPVSALRDQGALQLSEKWMVLMFCSSTIRLSLASAR